MRDASGRIVRWFGTCTDIHETKLAQEEREVIAQELSHRIKNIFAVIGGIVGLAARSHPEATEFAEKLRGCILALGRAHDFVRPSHSRSSMPRPSPSSLHALVMELLQPYRVGEVDRVSFDGPDAEIDDGAATPLALLFHELATNAANYGALTRADGHVAIETALDGDDYQLVRRERGGPAPAPGATGFGSKLISLSVEGQLRGRLERRYGEEGLEITLWPPQQAPRRKAELRREPELHDAGRTARDGAAALPPAHAGALRRRTRWPAAAGRFHRLGQNADGTRHAIAQLRRIGSHVDDRNASGSDGRRLELDARRAIDEVDIDEGEFGVARQLEGPPAICGNAQRLQAQLVQHAFQFRGDEDLVLDHQYLATHLPTP